MEKQKTALQKLQEVIDHNNANGQGVTYASVSNLVQQLFPTEKEQIEKAWNKGAEQCYDNITAEEFYTNTYTDETKL